MVTNNNKIPNQRLDLAFLFWFSACVLSSVSLHLNPEFGFIHTKWVIVLACILYTWPVINAQAIEHANKIQAGKNINHALASIVRVLLAVLIAVCLHIQRISLWPVVLLTLFLLFWFGFTFTIRLNWYRGKSIIYISSSKRSSFTDRLFYTIGNSLSPQEWIDGPNWIAGVLQLFCFLLGAVYCALKYVQL